MKLNIVFTRVCNGGDAGVFTFIKGMSTLLSGEVRCFCNRTFLGLIRTWLNNRDAVISIHCIWGIGALFLMVLSKVQNRKLFIFPHGMCEPWAINSKNKQLKILVLRVIKFVANHNFVFVCLSGMEYENLRNILPDKHIEIITPYVHSGVSGWEKRETDLNILFLGRLHSKKGIEELLAVANQLPDGIKLHIAGLGSPEIVQRVRCISDTSDQIVFHGELRGRDKWTLYERCHALILPTYSENFGYVVPEALSAGCIILTTENTPWPTLLHGNIGFVPIKSVTTQGILEAIDELQNLILQTNDIDRTIYLENRNFYIKNFSRKYVQKKYETFFS